MKPRGVSVAGSPELQRRTTNANLPDYGDTLPDLENTPDAKIFVLNGVIYQAQNGVWVALT